MGNKTPHHLLFLLAKPPMAKNFLQLYALFPPSLIFLWLISRNWSLSLPWESNVYVLYLNSHCIGNWGKGKLTKKKKKVIYLFILFVFCFYLQNISWSLKCCILLSFYIIYIFLLINLYIKKILNYRFKSIFQIEAWFWPKIYPTSIVDGKMVWNCISNVKYNKRVSFLNKNKVVLSHEFLEFVKF